ncbi:TRL-like family protein [Leptospira yasudae]|uniref:adhesin Lsa14 n=1 Tax=Leptospira yasudae TaxID=2202201 RepID=UPI000E59B46A|nr:TRL-like family protein [Leptospira yasudae]RHX93719.1 TRL-like family protein [Leptospira yasudae]
MARFQLFSDPRIPIRVPILFLLLFVFQCTGVNILNSPVGSEEMNTNPTPAYGRPSLELWYKGGLIFHNESIPHTINGNARSLERGESCSRSALALFAWGDSSIRNASRKANIQKIAHIEYEHTAILGIVYHSFCTIVTGESATAPAVKVREEVKEKRIKQKTPTITEIKPEGDKSDEEENK